MYNRIFWGFVLIGLGVLFILDQRGIVTFDLREIITTYWPLILIYFGLRGLIFQHRWGQGIGFGYLYPLIMTVLGVYFLGRNIDYIEMSVVDFFQYVIPFLLIIIGLIIILRPSRRTSDQTEPEDAVDFDLSGYGEPHESEESKQDGAAPHSFIPEENWRIGDEVRSAEAGYAEAGYTGGESAGSTGKQEAPESHFSFLGDIHIGSANWQLKPLNVHHFIGDTVIDLTRAQIPDGITKINVSSMIGNVKVMLPKDPEVEASVVMTAFLGEFNVFGRREGGMLKNYREESPHYPYARKKIQLTANLFIGDFRIERI